MKTIKIFYLPMELDGVREIKSTPLSVSSVSCNDGYAEQRSPLCCHTIYTTSFATNKLQQIYPFKTRRFNA